jgi:hypothetical protein
MCLTAGFRRIWVIPLLQLVRDRKTHIGVGTPTHTRWLFPGGLPGQPITPKRLADRLRALGIPTQAARRAALTDLAAQLPAAVLADLLDLHPTTRWRASHIPDSGPYKVRCPEWRMPHARTAEEIHA